ncbi:MAG: type II secretion system secretin GspD [Pseudomonadales bacterium]
MLDPGRWLILLIFLLAPLAASSEESWKINLKNADIREFITQVSAITGKSFIVDPRVKGNVTVVSNTSMDKDAVYDLFLSVLRVHGYAAVPSDGAIKIVQQVLAKQSGNKYDFSAEAPGEELITRVLTVKNSHASELVKILRPLIPQYGHVASLDDPNALIVSDHANNIDRLEEIVDRIDVADTSTIEIIRLEQAWVEDMVGLLEQLAPEQIGQGAKGPNKVRIVASERTNSLVLKGEPETLERLRRLIDSLDVPSNRSGSIQVVRLAHADAEEMAELLKDLISNAEPGEQGAQNIEISIKADTGLNALVIRANPTDMGQIKSIIGQLDIRRLQVLIEAAIVEVTSDFTRELGTELAVADLSASNIPLGLTAPSGTLSGILQSIALGEVTNIPNLGDSPLIAGGRLDNEDGFNFAFIIRALSRNSDVNLLSTPSITTMDNQEAKIVVGQNVPFRTGSTLTGSNQGSVNPFTTIQREDVGLTLEVTPHIHDGQLVRLEILQEVSEVDQSSLQSIGSNGSADIITNKRTIQTTVLADNGEVIILGGLIRDRKTEGNTRVPLLGDIPGLGRLFKRTNVNTEKQNLLVFLRPTVLSTREEIKEQTERKYSGVWDLVIEGEGEGEDERDPAEAISDLFDGKK